MAMICLAVKSRKVSSPLTLRRDLALSSPIPVPRPPLSLRTTVDDKSEESTSLENSTALARSGDGEMVDSGIIPVFPDTSELKVDSNAEIAEGAIPSASILACTIHEKQS